MAASMCGPSAASLCLLLRLCALPTAGGAQSLAAFYGALRALSDRVHGAAAALADGGNANDAPSNRPAVSERVLLIDKPVVAAYAPLDANATALLLNDTEAVPDYPSCAYFNGSVYCVGDYYSVKTWRFSHLDGSPLPAGPDLHRSVQWPGNGRLANVNDEWLVTCGNWRLWSSDKPVTCEALHVHASRWVEVRSEACGQQSAVAEHSGSAFVVGGWRDDARTAEVWSLRINSTAVGNDTFQWRRHPDMNTARFLLAIASHNGYLYACGGDVGTLTLAVADCERWREGMHSWQAIAPLPEAREQLHLLSVDGRLIAMGGYDNDWEHRLDVFDYNESEDTWSRLHDMPDMEWFGSAVVPAL